MAGEVVDDADVGLASVREVELVPQAATVPSSKATVDTAVTNLAGRIFIRSGMRGSLGTAARYVLAGAVYAHAAW
ncbi:hypothetical protein GCM10010319_48820 [Streptomyces blastmyceticus]|uniref:Uncharacterized protein n=1 Tax=Streptomyces blastmyceticus TaxID=68180 RepID=A0ABP3HD52_9ACTN